jgi:hypothetical protein
MARFLIVLFVVRYVERKGCLWIKTRSLKTHLPLPPPPPSFGARTMMASNFADGEDDLDA